jgi:hypothetical protein
MTGSESCQKQFLIIFTFMKVKYFLVFIALVFAIGVNARSKKTTKKKTYPYFILVEAYVQHTLPGIPSQLPTTGEHFIIVWKAAKFPETFFWRGEDGWLPCKMVKAHKIVNKTKSTPEGMDYTTAHVKGDEIHIGDTLELTPVIRGRFPVPPEIPRTAKNTLFFKAGKSGWLSFPVESIGRKQDIVNP